MKENKKVHYLYCEEIKENEIQEYITRKYPDYKIKDMSEETYDRFRDDLFIANELLTSDLDYLFDYGEDKSLYAKIKKEIQLELLEAMRVNAIIQLSDIAVSYLDNDYCMEEEEKGNGNAQ